MLLGAIEAGGTKIIVAISTINGKILKKEIFPTSTPDLTMPKIINFLKNNSTIDAIGIASFGPLDLDKKSKTYGSITSTPKLPWQHYNIVNEIKKHFDHPIGFDTDVNGAALAEVIFGKLKDIDSLIYITVGTGIGVGAILNNKLVHGLIHPEMGHIIIPKREDDDFKGVCPFHNSCLESLASGPSMMKRWNIESALSLDKNHIGWDLEAHYLAIGITNYILTLSPKKIVIGGGVMKHFDLFSKIRKKVTTILNGYLKTPMIQDKIDEYIIEPTLKDDVGILGAVALAKKALEEKNEKH
jgi:fructokinase